MITHCQHKGIFSQDLLTDRASLDLPIAHKSQGHLIKQNLLNRLRLILKQHLGRLQQDLQIIFRDCYLREASLILSGVYLFILLDQRITEIQDVFERDLLTYQNQILLYRFIDDPYEEFVVLTLFHGLLLLMQSLEHFKPRLTLERHRDLVFMKYSRYLLHDLLECKIILFLLLSDLLQHQLIIFEQKHELSQSFL